MKKNLAAVAALACLAIGMLFAQSDGLKSADQVKVHVTRFQSPEATRNFVEPGWPLTDGLKIGPNMVTVRVIRDNKVIYEETNHNLKTTVGVDAMIAQVGTTGTQPAAFDYLCLSSDTGAPAITDTVVAGEITGSGLGRAIATYAHTAGTSTWTETKTWTATATVSNVQKAGALNASSAGTLGFENTFTPVSLNSGDQLQLTWTVTAS